MKYHYSITFYFKDHQSADLTTQRGNKFITKPFIDQLSRFINNSSQQLFRNRVIQHINADHLKNVARARVSIVSACKLLCDIHITGKEVDRNDLETLQAFFPLLMMYIQQEPNSQLHFFVLRQIVFEHGSRELDQVIQRSEYDWLKLHINDPAGQNTVRFFTVLF